MFQLVPLGEGQLPSKATERARKQQDVFRPSWNLPTVSVEEAAAVEMRFAAKSKPEGSAEASDDEEDESDEALRKAREWDEYKDTHPIGWGNRINQG
jgi:immunoglobulin-binding protein 1